MARARAIAELARERAQQTEADRRVGEDMIERMRQADLFRVMQPEAYGGFEYGFDVFVEIVAAVARGCGSTGWVYGLLASHQWLIACFPRAAQDEVWHDRSALAAGTYAPVGHAVAADGGYRLSGTGSFCSGCDNAQWQLLGGMIPQPDGSAKPGFFLMPTADCSIDDNWHTMGLAGTGSKNIVVRDVLVPVHRTLAFAELADATAPGMRGNANPLYRQSFLAVLPITIVSPVLGMAEGALADFLAMAGARTTAARWPAATAAWPS
jgi:alkylation response protein AidB-like acyl-CoA dehydrogenase